MGVEEATEAGEAMEEDGEEATEAGEAMEAEEEATVEEVEAMEVEVDGAEEAAMEEETEAAAATEVVVDGAEEVEMEEEEAEVAKAATELPYPCILQASEDASHSSAPVDRPPLLRSHKMLYWPMANKPSLHNRLLLNPRRMGKRIQVHPHRTRGYCK